MVNPVNTRGLPKAPVWNDGVPNSWVFDHTRKAKVMRKPKKTFANRAASAIAVAVGCMTFVHAGQAAVPAYRTTVLQPLQSTDWVAAYAINDKGLVTGFSAVGEPWGRMNGVVWDTHGVPSVLPLPGPYPRSSGAVITNSGHVLGWGDEANYDTSYSFIVANGQARELTQEVPGFRGISMNEAGQVAGFKRDTDAVLVINPDGSRTEVNAPAGSHLHGLHLGNDGSLAATLVYQVGSTDFPIPTYKAGIWRDGQWLVLDDARVVDFTHRNQALVAREWGAADAVWDGHTLTEVPASPLGGNMMAMNDEGDMLGAFMFNGGGADYYYARLNGQDVKLDDLLDPALRAAGWSVNTGSIAINNVGQILVGAYDPSRQVFSAVVLSPVPEPSGAALALVGVVAAGRLARRGRARA